MVSEEAPRFVIAGDVTSAVGTMRWSKPCPVAGFTSVADGEDAPPFELTSPKSCLSIDRRFWSQDREAGECAERNQKKIVSDRIIESSEGTGNHGGCESKKDGPARWCVQNGRSKNSDVWQFYIRIVKRMNMTVAH